jgi:predicted RNA-binding Zn-ribbon protein involved in translation (DUF1610 family)
MAPFITVASPETVAERPTCPKCGNVMRLVWRASNKDDQDRYSFECPACNNHGDLLLVRDPVLLRRRDRSRHGQMHDTCMVRYVDLVPVR